MTRLGHIAIAATFFTMSGFATASMAEDAAALTRQYFEVELARKAAQTPADMQTVIADYQRLAEQGQPRSAFRLGNIFFRGTLTEQDTAKGIAFYRLAIENGHGESLRYLANALLKTGQGEEAFATFERARAAGIGGLDRSVAKAHISRDFGRFSDPSIGIALLEDMVEQGDAFARVELAKALTKPFADDVELGRSHTLLEPLAAENDPVALTQLARLYGSGLGVERDYDRAADLYHRAADAGDASALVRAAQMEFLRGQRSQALASLNAAIKADVPGAQIELAVAHVRQTFGEDLSSRPLGVQMLKAGVEAGDINAVVATLDMLSEGRRFRFDMDELLDRAEAAADGGNVRAAEALLRITRDRGRLVKGAWKRRGAYLDSYGELLSPSRFADEKVHYTLDAHGPLKSRSILREELQGFEDVAYYKGMVAISREDRNAYTYLLQSELKRLGYYSGQASGDMTQASMRAALQFCQDNGYFDTCRRGLFRGAAVRLMVASLIDRRSEIE